MPTVTPLKASTLGLSLYVRVRAYLLPGMQNYSKDWHENWDEKIVGGMLQCGITGFRCNTNTSPGNGNRSTLLEKREEMWALGFRQVLAVTTTDFPEGDTSWTQLVAELNRSPLSVEQVIVEGFNEVNKNSNNQTYDGGTAGTDNSAEALKLRQANDNIYDAVKGDNAGRKVASYSFTAMLVENLPTELEGMTKTDYGNIHVYAGYPSSPRYDEMAATMAGNFPGKPIVVTEYGASNYGLASAQNAYGEDASPSIATEFVAAFTEEEQSWHLVRGWLLFANKGAVLTTLFELIDDSDSLLAAEGNWGIIRFDGTKKPAFYAIKAVKSILSESRVPFFPYELDHDVVNLELTLSNSDEDIKYTVAQKADGHYIIFLWVEAPIIPGIFRNPFVGTVRKELGGWGPRKLTTNITVTGATGMHLYEPFLSSREKSTFYQKGNTFTGLELGPAPIILEVE